MTPFRRLRRRAHERQLLGSGALALVRATDLVAEFAGIFDETVYPAGYLDRLRREW